jgi:hypothetical protein
VRAKLEIPALPAPHLLKGINVQGVEVFPDDRLPVGTTSFD